ncbi:MAG: molybdate ABC transporter substrate-binding protein [Armatimonadia bacterium]|nr:molybdate ABC transporter substrate-binding protein [Armatimonadia bacterium]
MVRKHAMIVGGLLAATILMLLGGCGEQAAETPGGEATPPAEQMRGLKLMVPCGMILPVRAVTDEFERQHPNVEMEIVLDNAVVLAKRIRDKGETADVFLSPGEQQMRLLEDADLIADGSKRSFANLTLVCAVVAGNPLGIDKPEDLMEAETISCPDPELNSAGLYARRSLTELGLWEKLQPNMVLTEHAIESHHLLANGKSQAAFMYLRCPLQTSEEKIPQSRVEVAFELPRETYAPAEACAAVLANAPEPDLASQFMEFISSEQGLALIEASGLQPIDRSANEDAVVVEAYYPDNEGHREIKDMLARLEEEHGSAVSTEFIDFQSDEGFERWQAAGLTCGAVLINGERNVTLTEDGRERQVSFTMGPGTYWTEEDLKAVVAEQLQAE